MDIDRLRYFVVLSDSSTMREAAEHLCISQPALSKAMKLLESELGEKLFVSSGRRVLVTDKGKLIAVRAKKILEDLKHLTDAESLENNNTLKLGSFEVFTTYFLGFVFNKEFNGSVVVREFVPGVLEENIVSGVVDVGITYLPIPKRELEFIKVTEVTMEVYGASSFVKEPFDSLPFVVPITPLEGVPHKVKGLDGWPDDKIPRKIKYQVELMETALELCRQGLAVAYLPQFVVNFHNKQVCEKYSLKPQLSPKAIEPFKQGVYIIKRKSDVEGPYFRKIAAALRKLK